MKLPDSDVTATWHSGFKSDSPAPLRWQIKPGLRWELDAVQNRLKIEAEGKTPRSVMLEKDFRPSRIDEIRYGKAYRIYGQIGENGRSFTLLNGVSKRWYGVGKGVLTTAEGRIISSKNSRNINELQR